jgi:hypothetical protein
MAEDRGTTVREAVAVFDDEKALEEAMDELTSTGFDRAEISLLAGADTVEQSLGHRFRKVAELEDDAGAPRTFYVSKEAIGDAEGALIGGLLYVGAVAAAGVAVATGGALAAAITAAALAGGTGGLIGATLAKLLGDHHAKYLQEQLDRGGLLLWVRTRDAAHEERATGILRRHSGHDVHVHDLPVG